MSEDPAFIVLVRFATTAEEQPQALQEIGHYVASFLSQQPGFIESFLQHDDAGLEIVHFARWTSEQAFRAFAEAAQQHPALPLLRRYQPAAQFLQGWRRFTPGAADPTSNAH